MALHLFESELVVSELRNVKDDDAGRYAEQLLGHAQHHTLFAALNEPELTGKWQHF